MAIDQNLVGNTALALMGRIEATTSEEATIGAIGFIVAVDNGDGTSTTHHVFRSGDGAALARYQGIGLLEEVIRAI